MHVDDLAMSVVGEVSKIYKDMVRAGEFLAKEFGIIKLTIRKTTIVTASEPSAAREVSGQLAKKGIPCTPSLVGRDLGVDCGAGRRRSVKVMNARFAKAKKRISKLKVLKRYDKRSKTLHQTNIWPASNFGISAMGVPPSSVAKLRRDAGVCCIGPSRPVHNVSLSSCFQAWG